MNVKSKQDPKKNLKLKTREDHGPKKWGRNHGVLINELKHDHERPEARLTR
jgi:hypothetical protein